MTQASGTVLCSWLADFETGNLGQLASTQGSTSSSLTVVASPVRSGTHAIKAFCDASDPPLFGHNHRSEVILGPAVFGEFWYGWSTHVPTGWIESAGYHLITQFHHDDTDPSTDHNAAQPIQLVVDGSTIYWQHESGDIPAPTDTTLWTATLTKGAWIDWVVHVNWTTDASGYIAIWKDGVQIVDYHGAVLTPNGGGAYFKTGLTYDVSETQTVYSDEMRMMNAAGSYAAVAPR